MILPYYLLESYKIQKYKLYEKIEALETTRKECENDQWEGKT